MSMVLMMQVKVHNHVMLEVILFLSFSCYLIYSNHYLLLNCLFIYSNHYLLFIAALYIASMVISIAYWVYHNKTQAAALEVAQRDNKQQYGSFHN